MNKDISPNMGGSFYKDILKNTIKNKNPLSTIKNPFMGLRSSTTYLTNAGLGRHKNMNTPNILNNKISTLQSTLKTEDIDLEISYLSFIEETVYKRNMVTHTGSKQSAVPHGLMNKITQSKKPKINQKTSGIIGDLEKNKYAKNFGLKALMAMNKNK